MKRDGAERTYRFGSMILTEEQARRAGLLPDQRLARHRRTLATLEQYGRGETQFARATRAAVRRLERGGDAQPPVV